MESNIQIGYTINHFFKVLICLLLGLYLSLIPLPDWLEILRPDFFILTLAYLLLQGSPRPSLRIVFFIGIFVDVLLSSPMGTHSLAFILMSVMTVKLYHQLLFFPIMQQAAYVASLVFLCNLIIFIIMYFTMHNKEIIHLFVSWVSAFIVWPWLKVFFNQIFQDESVG